MKKTQLLGASLLLCYITAYSQEPLKFAQIINTPDQVIGSEVLKIAYQRLSIPITIVVMPGKRALIESSQGRLDGEVHRIFQIGKDYPTLKRVPTPINYIEPSVFSKTKKFTVTGCPALKDFTIGIVRGVRHAEVCTTGMKYVQIVANSKDLMQLLDIGRTDIVITARINGLLQLKRLNLDSITPLSPPLSKKEVYHYLHAKHSALVPKIDGVFKAMKKSGELASLRKKVINEMLVKAAADK